MLTGASKGCAGLVVAILCFWMTANARAQDRMPPIPGDKLSGEQQKAIEEYRTARGGTGGTDGPWAALVRSPEVMNRARAMGDYLRFRTTLPPRLSEFIILITARSWSQNYEWSVHYDLAIRGGLRPEVAKAIAEGRRPDRMAPDEDAIYSFLSELQRNQSVSDVTYARMVSQFGEKGVIDAVGIAGYYTLLAMVLNTARTPVPDGATPALTPFPR